MGRLHVGRRAADVRDRPRALMSRPKMILLDETLDGGLRRRSWKRSSRSCATLNQKEKRLVPAGRAEHLSGAQNMPNTVTSWRTARVVMDGDAKIAARERGREGNSTSALPRGKRKSFRDVKHYKRRKRWLT